MGAQVKGHAAFYDFITIKPGKKQQSSA